MNNIHRTNRQFERFFGRPLPICDDYTPCLDERNPPRVDEIYPDKSFEGDVVAIITYCPDLKKIKIERV